MGSDGAFKIGARVRVEGWLECCYSLRGHELQGRFRWVKGGVMRSIVAKNRRK